jgi:hypothetical protein
MKNNLTEIVSLNEDGILKKRTILIKEVDGEAVVPLTQFIELLQEKHSLEEKIKFLTSQILNKESDQSE